MSKHTSVRTPLATVKSPLQARRHARRHALFANALEGLEQRRLFNAVVGIAASDAAAAEALLATGKFRLTRDLTVGALTVDLDISGTATNGTDYNTVAATATFAAGVAFADVTITPKEDASFEGEETVVISLADGDDYTADADADSATVTLADNDKPTVSIAATDATATEGEEDALTTGTFTVTRTGTTADALTVKLAISGTAASGDYETIATTVTIPEDEDSVEITVTPTDDSTLEDVEKVILTLAADAAYTVATGAAATATVNISDDELPTVIVAAADATALEGSATDTGKFTLTRNGPTTAALDVNFTFGGTGNNGTDYDTLSGTATIPAGKASIDVILKTKQDAFVEGSESATLTLSTKSTYELDNSKKAATVTISDDDKPVVSLAATDSAASESGGNTSAYFTVTRTGTTKSTLVVPLVITGTATKGSDFKSFANSVTIPAGKASVQVKVKAKDDELLEGSETVILTLGASTDFIADAAKSGTVTLGDDEVPEVSISATDALAGEPGTDKGTFTVTRDGPTTSALTVNYAVGGSATNGTDTDTIATSVVIPAGKAVATITVAAKDDTSLEGTETVTLTLADAASYDADAALDVATVKISDNEKPTVTLSATDGTAAEEESATGTFVLTRDGPTTGELKVTVVVAGTATKGDDYAVIGTSVTIAAGSATKTFKVTPVDDSTVELDETVIVTVGADAAYTVGEAKTGTVTIAENDLPTVTMTGTKLTAGEPAEKGTITLTRNGPLTAALTVKYVASGTATSGTDYTALTGTAVIPIGKPSITLDVVAKEDTDLEGKETVIVTLSEDDAYTFDESKDVLTVAVSDNEKPSVSIVATDATAPEDDTDEAGTFTVTRTGPTTDALEIAYVTTGTAVTGTDTNTALSGKVTIAAGQASKTISIVGKDDAAYEGSETITLTLKPTPTIYTIEDAKKAATVTVTDDDKPTVSIVATKASTKENTKDALVYTITRDGNPAAALTVALTTTGTAVAGDVAVAFATSVTIPAGKLFSTVTIAPKDDTTYEGPETIIVTIDDEDADYVADADKDAATATILENDTPTVSIIASDTTAAEKELATGLFEVSRGVLAAEDLTVNLSIAGTAKNGRDYIKIEKTVFIPAGSSTAVFTLRPKADSAVEGSETVVLGLATGVGYTIKEDKKSATVTIDDEQTPTVSVAAQDASIAEADGSGTWFRISRNGRTLSSSLVVKLALTGTAEGYTIQDEDGDEVTDTITLAAGEAYVDVYVAPTDNDEDGDDTTIILTLDEDDAYEIDGSAGDATVTIADDD